jgi:sulfatase maturation enzyme AslB (radical SAM superfamily)
MIALGEDDRRLYDLSDFKGPLVTGGAIPPGWRVFKDLIGGHAFHVRSDDAVGLLIADEAVHDRLRTCATEGRRVGSDCGPDDLPLAGNLVDPSWLSISLGGRCGSRCRFCYTEEIRHDPPLSSRQVRAVIDAAAEMGTIETVVLTGGEPTIRPDLDALIRYTAEAGFRTITLQTNGHRLADPSQVKRLSEAGLTGVLLSLHGATAKTHDGLVGVAGSFELACRALRELVAHGIAVTVNFVACRENLDEIDRFVDAVDDLAAGTPIRVSYPIVEGAAFENADELLPDLLEFADRVRAARAVRSAPGSVDVANVPACVAVRAGAAPSYLVSQRRSLMLASPFYRGAHIRGEVLVKLAPCERCVYASDCHGLQLPYIKRFPEAHRHVRALVAKDKALEFSQG